MIRIISIYLKSFFTTKSLHSTVIRGPTFELLYKDNEDNTIFSIPMNLIQTFVEISDIRIQIRGIVYRKIKIT